MSCKRGGFCLPPRYVAWILGLSLWHVHTAWPLICQLLETFKSSWLLCKEQIKIFNFWLGVCILLHPVPLIFFKIIRLSRRLYTILNGIPDLQVVLAFRFFSTESAKTRTFKNAVSILVSLQFCIILYQKIKPLLLDFIRYMFALSSLLRSC